MLSANVVRRWRRHAAGIATIYVNISYLSGEMAEAVCFVNLISCVQQIFFSNIMFFRYLKESTLNVWKVF